MSVINKQFKIKKSKEEMKMLVNQKILELPVLKSVVTKVE
jgi:hypothetical protein